MIVSKGKNAIQKNRPKDFGYKLSLCLSLSNWDEHWTELVKIKDRYGRRVPILVKQLKM